MDYQHRICVIAFIIGESSEEAGNLRVDSSADEHESHAVEFCFDMRKTTTTLDKLTDPRGSEVPRHSEGDS